MNDQALTGLLLNIRNNLTRVIEDMAGTAEASPYRGLTFAALRAANEARMPEFRNAQGELSHSQADGSDWTPAQWLQATVGELGEYANKRKKFERGDIDEEQFTLYASEELADTIIYLDILAKQLGINLDEAVARKFNRTSLKVGSRVRLTVDGEMFEVDAPLTPFPGNEGPPTSVRTGLHQRVCPKTNRDCTYGCVGHYCYADRSMTGDPPAVDPLAPKRGGLPPHPTGRVCPDTQEGCRWSCVESMCFRQQEAVKTGENRP